MPNMTKQKYKIVSFIHVYIYHFVLWKSTRKTNGQVSTKLGSYAFRKNV